MTIEQSLKDKFEKVFGFKKTTFNAPSSSDEQNCLFIELDNVYTQVKDNEMTAKVMGKCSIYARASELPAGYFGQRIRAAAVDLTKDLFFYDFEQNIPMEVDIVKRGFAFVYLYAGQYDPHDDNISSIEIEGIG